MDTQGVFATEIVPHEKALLAQALRLTKDKYKAEDLCQETLLKAWIGIDSYTPGTNALNWLHRIMQNRHVDMYRSQQTKPDEVYSFEDFNEALDAVESAETSHFDDHINPILLQALDQLPENFREAFWLHKVEDLSVNQVSELLGIPRNTVLTRIHRAKLKLQELLIGYESEVAEDV